MKVLFLNPHIDAKHHILRALEKRQVAILAASTSETATELFHHHEQSLDLAVLHREGAAGEPGIEFLNQLKSLPSGNDLPVILTSESWGDVEFAQHQQTPQGANAYLKYPFTADQLAGLIEAVFGEPLGIHQDPIQPSSVVLEEPSQIFQVQGSVADGTATIQLNAPEGATPPPFDPHPSSAPLEGLTLSMMAAPEATGMIPSDAIQPAPAITEALVPAPSEPLVFSGSATPQTPEPTTVATDADLVLPTLASEMPYLLSEEDRKQISAHADALPPVFEALPENMIPGSAAQEPDLETIKKYLYLREQDVATLTTKLRTAQERISALEFQFREEKARNVELMHLAHEQKRELSVHGKKKEQESENLHESLKDLRTQIQLGEERVQSLQTQLLESEEEKDRLKERVRIDIRKIRVREKELENRLELLKKDSEILLASRETKITELKRKLDLVEFNQDLLQHQYIQEKEKAQKLREQFARASNALKMAGGLLDPAVKANLEAGFEESKPKKEAS